MGAAGLMCESDMDFVHAVLKTLQVVAGHLLDIPNLDEARRGPVWKNAGMAAARRRRNRRIRDRDIRASDRSSGSPCGRTLLPRPAARRWPQWSNFQP